MKSKITLREALESVNLKNVYKMIARKDKLKQDVAIARYSTVVQTLLSKKKSKPDMPWLVSKGDAYFINQKYEAPAKGLKPWGCHRGQKPPIGYYDINSDKHCYTFAAGFKSWDKIIDASIIIKGNLSLEQAVAEILMEITYYGINEVEIQKATNSIKKRLDKAYEEIKNGKYTEIPPVNYLWDKPRGFSHEPRPNP